MTIQTTWPGWGAECHPDPDLLRALRDRIGQDPVDAEDGEQPGGTREAADDGHHEAAHHCGLRVADPIRQDGELEWQVGIARVHDLPCGGDHVGRRDVALHDDKRPVARPLLERHVDDR